MRIGDGRRERFLARAFALGAGVGIAAALAPCTGAAADREKVLYSFCAQGGGNCTDGAIPAAGLIMGPAGNLYGTTSGGGTHFNGTAFELTPNAAKTVWTHKVLYSFCAQGGKSCTDGVGPQAGVIMDAAGDLYGTTNFGGAHEGGTAFELTPNKAKTVWTEKVLYSFCAQASCADGSAPQAGLIMDAAGNLYGTTALGGAHNGPVGVGGGTAFELTPNAATKTAWTEKVLYSFCAQPKCTDGFMPDAGLIMDRQGNLYGTTQGGGAHNNGGTAFELTPNAATKTAWTEKVLYSFCAQGGGNCTDGGGPLGLIMDAAGRLYGTTNFGGAHGLGTAFELIPNAAKTAWMHKVLYSFCAQPKCADGSRPLAGLIVDAAGNLYGTTAVGGAHGDNGTAFELTPNKARTAWTREPLYSFCAQGEARCTDGAHPVAGLVRDRLGNLYGTTLTGGAHNNPNTVTGGTAFELTP